MVAARVSGSTWPDATRLGALIDVRGLMELVVLMALATTMMAVPLIHFLVKERVS